MSNVSYEILTPPSVEPLQVADMKPMLRVVYTDEDTFIAGLITKARRYAEQVTGRALAPQVIRATIEPLPIPQGALSGPVGDDFDIYRLNERITSVPFGFYGPRFPLPWAIVSAVTTVEYQLTPFDNQPASTMQWTNLPQFDASNFAQWLLDTNVRPMQLVIMPMMIANRFRVTYSAGYNSSSGYATGAVPDEIIEQMQNWVSFRFDNRQGEPLPESITRELRRMAIWTL